jgi:hypothetical protein
LFLPLLILFCRFPNVYDPLSSLSVQSVTWSALDSVPFTARFHSMIQVYQQRIFLIGGDGPLGKLNDGKKQLITIIAVSKMEIDTEHRRKRDRNTTV